MTSNDSSRADTAARILFYVVLCLGLALLFFGAGLWSGATRNALYRAAVGVRDDVVLVFRELGVLTGRRPAHFLQPARTHKQGVTVNSLDNDELILLASFWEGRNQLRLVRRDGGVVNAWDAVYSQYFPDPAHVPEPPATDWNIDVHGALALPDGSVVFNFEYAGLVRLDRHGEVVWTLDRPTHHAVELADDNTLWVPCRRFVPARKDRTLRNALRVDDYIQRPRDYLEEHGGPIVSVDTLMQVSLDGEVLQEFPVDEIFLRNGLEALLTATGQWFYRDMYWDLEIVHLNKIEPLPAALAADFPGLEPGDLALSLRTYNMLLVVDPDGWRVKWHQTGPWLRQHDPEFLPGGWIALFNNDSYYVDEPPVSSTIMAVDPASNATRTVWGSAPGQNLGTVIRGKLDPTPRGGWLITEFEGGRALETDAAGNIVWEYVNRYDAESVAEISEARLYPPGYFRVEAWRSKENVQ